MAMLATLEGFAENRGGIFGACLGACDSVGRTVRGCLGVFDFAEPDDEMSINKAIEIYKEMGQRSDPDFELGVFNYPVFNFVQKFFELKRNSPQYNDEEAAAITYFGMVAGQPIPTAIYNDIAIDWDKIDAIVYNDENGLDPNKVLPWWEMSVARNDGGAVGKIKGKWQIWFPVSGIGANEYLKNNSSTNVRLTRDLKTSYVAAVYHLNRFLVYNGLYKGVEKTLAEESRRLQGLRAKALASQAAAARALALAKTSEDISVEKIQEYQNQLNDAQEKEKELTDYLNRLKNLPSGTGNVDTDGKTTSSFTPLIIAALAALAFMG